ncbi:DUF4334 domain-containing protein [Actinoplanes sp. NPDC026619]|uniref:DUF4334 domain-containing protein n=1 Tax=Actinoplanes sp. NPDC026619 TaxID=3155798 RepID=UPI0033EDE479
MSSAAEQRHARIMKAAAVTFARYGYRRTSMEAVASAAGMSRPALYQYFSNKEAVFREMTRWLLERNAAVTEVPGAPLERFAKLREQAGRIDAGELDEVWALLGTVRPEEILGEWRGSEFDTGHPLNGRLEQAGWFGKTFVSVSDAKPLICRDAEGKLYSNTELGKGEASLWNIEFRGEVTATMVYDGQPVFDHFKRVDDDTLMGIMNVKQNGGLFYYFILERA